MKGSYLRSRGLLSSLLLFSVLHRSEAERLLYQRYRGLLSSSLLPTVPQRPEADRFLPEIQGPVVLLAPVRSLRGVLAESERI
jgi:hypothetical protein